MIESIIGFILLAAAAAIVFLGIPGLMIGIVTIGLLLCVVVVLIGIATDVASKIRGALS